MPATVRCARTLTILTAALLTLQAAGGLLIPGLYRDNAWIASVFRGTDLNALLIDVPMLLLAFVSAVRGSLRARILWLGALYYIFYNNLYFLFGCSFNRFFLVYVAIFVSSATAIVAILLDMRAPVIAAVNPGMRSNTVSNLLFGCASLLAIMWIGQSLAYIVTGRLPQLISDSGGITHMVAALDLTLIVPPMILGAAWLRRARPWGFVISSAMSVQGLLITIDLVVAAPFQAAAGIPDAWAMVPLWAGMFVVFFVSARMLLGALPGVAGSAVSTGA
jgi:hypothetical protein